MQLGLVLLFALASPASALHVAARRPKAAMKAKQVDKAHVYVMNLARRTDRCRCMQKQLAASPYPVFRQEAADHHDHKTLKQCKSVPQMPENQEAGCWPCYLFCTNFMAWNHAMKNNRSSEFIILLEDDVHIKPEFWQKVQGLLDSDCGGWDYLAVDTFGSQGGAGPCDFQSLEEKKKNAFGFEVENDAIQNPWGWDQQVANQAWGEQGQKLNPWGLPDYQSGNYDFKQLQLRQKKSGGANGAHMQIIRKSALPKLIESAHQNGPATMDHWDEPMFARSSMSLKMWQAGIVSQAAKGGGAVPEGCEAGMAASDLDSNNVTIQEGACMMETSAI